MVNCCCLNAQMAENECDKEHKKVWTNMTFLCIFVLITGLVGFECYALATGDPNRLSYPINSAGEICGKGKHAGNPILLYFDLTQCAGISSTKGSCSTKQVCVEECPRTFWSFCQGKSSGLEHFCENITLTYLENPDTSLSRLVSERSCPAYLLPSQPVLGRCIPSLTLGGNEDALAVEEKLSAIKTEDGEAVKASNLVKGVEYLISSFDDRFEEKLLFDIIFFIWIILISSLLCPLLSLTWCILAKLVTKPFIWTSLCLTFGFLFAGSCFSIAKFFVLQTDDQEIPLLLNHLSTSWYNKYSLLVAFSVIIVLTLYFQLAFGYFFKHINITIKMIQEVSREIVPISSFIGIPPLQSLLDVLFLAWIVIIASYLATSLASVSRVVDACSSETCFNTNTGKMFAVNDVCDPGNFAECTGCPRAQCVHHSFQHSFSVSILQLCNFLGLFWLHSFIRSVGSMVMAGVFTRKFWKPGQSNEGVWTLIKETCQKHIGTALCGSLLPWMGVNSAVFVTSSVFGHNYCAARRRSIILLSRNTIDERNVHKTAKLILFAEKLFIVGCISVIAFIMYLVIFSTSIEIHFVNKFVPTIFILLGSCFISSNFLAMYDVAIDTLFIWNAQNKGKDKKHGEDSHILKVIFQNLFEERNRKLETENIQLNLL